jgi:hypothetical protein
MWTPGGRPVTSSWCGLPLRFKRSSASPWVRVSQHVVARRLLERHDRHRPSSPLDTGDPWRHQVRVRLHRHAERHRQRVPERQPVRGGHERQVAVGRPAVDADVEAVGAVAVLAQPARRQEGEHAENRRLDAEGGKAPSSDGRPDQRVARLGRCGRVKNDVGGVGVGHVILPARTAAATPRRRPTPGARPRSSQGRSSLHQRAVAGRSRPGRYLGDLASSPAVRAGIRPSASRSRTSRRWSSSVRVSNSDRRKAISSRWLSTSRS